MCLFINAKTFKRSGSNQSPFGSSAGKMDFSETAGLVVVSLALFYYYTTRNFGYWKKRGVEFIQPYPLVGSLFSVLTLQEHFDDFFTRMAKKYKGLPFVGMFQGPTPALLVLDPELIKNIFIKDFSHFMDHTFVVDEKIEPLISKNLFSMAGHRWKEMRNKLTPTFTSGKMRGMFPFVVDCSRRLEKYTGEHQGEDVNSRELLANYTTDVIGSCVFGINSDSINNPDEPFRVIGKKFIDVNFIKAVKNAFIVFGPKVAKFLHLKFLDDEVENEFSGMVKAIIDKRAVSGNTRKDFMQLLIQLKERGRLIPDEGDAAENNSEFANSAENRIDDDDIVGQSMVFFFAGYETSSSTVAFALMELARNPHVQQKAREDIEQVLERHDGVISYHSLKEMTYLDRILQETLRMYPSLSTLNRMCTENYTIPNTKILIDKGTAIFYPVRALQNDPEYFENPEIFEPERFDDEEHIRKNQFVYMPFGEGQRQCIGMRFAKAQSKLALLAILRNYEVLESPRTVYPPVMEPKQFLLCPKDDIFVQFKAIAG